MILHNIGLIPNKILMKLWTTWLAGAYGRSYVSHISLNCSNSAAEKQSRDLFEKHFSYPLSKNICNILLCFSCWYPKAVLPRFAGIRSYVKRLPQMRCPHQYQMPILVLVLTCNQSVCYQSSEQELGLILAAHDMLVE